MGKIAFFLFHLFYLKCLPFFRFFCYLILDGILCCFRENLFLSMKFPSLLVINVPLCGIECSQKKFYYWPFLFNFTLKFNFGLSVDVGEIAFSLVLFNLDFIVKFSLVTLCIHYDGTFKWNFSAWKSLIGYKNLLHSPIKFLIFSKAIKKSNFKL